MIKKLVKQYRWRITAAALLSALSAVAGIGLLMLVNQEVSRLSEQQLLSQASRTILYTAGVISLFAIGFFSQFMLAKLASNLVRELRAMMLKRILATDYQQLDQVGGHRLHATMTTDITSLSTALSVLPVFAYNATSILLCCAYLAWLSLPYFAIFFVVLALVMLGSEFIMRKGSARFKQLREHEDELFNTFKTLIDGAQELTLNAKRKAFFYQHQALPSLDNVQSSDVKAKFYWTMYNNWFSAM